MTLFGFIDAAERDAFGLLITVQGVGAKAAMAILSVLDPNALTDAIVTGDKAWSRVQMVLAQKSLFVLLMNYPKNWKIPSLGSEAIDVNLASATTDAADKAIQQDALSALINLGYGRSEAHAAVLRAQRVGKAVSASSLIAAALREMGT